MSAVSVVVLFSLRVSSCHALVTWIRRMRARSGESAARADGAPASPSAAAAVAVSAAASEGASMASTWFPRGRGSLLLRHLGGQSFRGGCAVVAGGDLEYCSWSTNPKAKAPSCTAVVSPSFRDNSVRSARTLRGGEVVLRKEAREKKKVKEDSEEGSGKGSSSSQAKEQESFTRLKWR